MSAAGPGGALDGVRIVDMATMVAGPLGASLLGQFGADVVKVEPIHGDESRTFGPVRDGQSGVFIGVNANKRGIALDLRKPAGLEALYGLCRTADVVIDNMRPRQKARLGIDTEALRTENPRLVTITVTSFGASGPYSERPGLDPVAQALTGLMYSTGPADGGPLKAGPPIADATAAHLVALAALLALLSRQQSGTGQAVTVSLVDALIHLQAPWIGQLFLSGYVQPRSGNASNFYAPYDTFTTSDRGAVHVVAHNDRFFGKLCRAIGREDLTTDPRFASAASRLAHRVELTDELADWFGGRTQTDAIKELTAHDVVCAPVLSYEDTFRDPQVQHNEMAVTVEHSVLGTVNVPGVPVKLSITPGAVQRPPPALGQHTVEILAELGYSRAQIDDLLAAGAAR